jgi:hypothetical protein
MNKFTLLCAAFLVSTCAGAQFAPQVGTTGTTAIHKDSSAIKAWALNCTLQLGWQNIADTTLGHPQAGDASYVPGKAGNGVVSLGDGGSAVVTFKHPVINGEGPDFAVFENGFIDQTIEPGTAFLELAFVEVSSDGTHYTRFPATSLNDQTTQLGSFEGMVADSINNFAGKYLGNYGTPFDLEELKDSAGLEVNHITHIRIIDVVGCVQDAYSSRDAHGNKVNDPWPTAFASSGFDLDAVAVINHDITQGLDDVNGITRLPIYPNPAGAHRQVAIVLPTDNAVLTVYDMLGNKINAYTETRNGNGISVVFSQTGCYQVTVQTDKGLMTGRIIID